MPKNTLSAETREKLTKVSTATICTALFKVGLKNQFIQDVLPLGFKGRNMVGQAYTLRYIPAREDLNPISVFQDPAHPQRVGVEECPEGYVMVIDSRKDPRAASAGSILVTRLMKRGCAGIVTDGGFRAGHACLPQPPLGTDQPPPPSGDRAERPDRLRRRCGVSGGRDGRRRRGCCRHPVTYGQRDR